MRISDWSSDVCSSDLDRRVTTARDQARIASDALRAASVRVQAGRASPLEQQRADVARINADANVERQLRLAEAARANLARRIGRPIDGALDDTLLDRLPGANIYGPVAPVDTRSAEHPSELQSLTRNPNDAFCLTKIK